MLCEQKILPEEKMVRRRCAASWCLLVSKRSRRSEDCDIIRHSSLARICWGSLPSHWMVSAFAHD